MSDKKLPTPTRKDREWQEKIAEKPRYLCEDFLDSAKVAAEIVRDTKMSTCYLMRVNYDS